MRLRSTSKEARAREAKNLRDISRDSGGSMVAPAMTAASQDCAERRGLGKEDAVELGDDGGVGLLDVLDAGFEHAHAPSFPGRMDALDEAGILQRVDRMGDHVGLQVNMMPRFFCPMGSGSAAASFTSTRYCVQFRQLASRGLPFRPLMGKLERHEKR